MIIKIVSVSLLLFAMGSLTAEEMGHEMKHDGAMQDSRISLNLPPMMKQHQLSNMRNHVDAVRRIIAAISTDNFDEASQIASNELGTSEEMLKMCNRFKNEDFKQMGLAFHESGDQLAKVLKTRNVKESLHALDNTMSYCVSCHAVFRQ